MKTSSKVLQKQNELSSTCPKTSSLTVNVRSRISVILLSFIHCKLWWNSSSRYSKSLRSVTLWTTQYRHPIKIHNLKLILTPKDLWDSQFEQGLVERSSEESIQQILVDQSQTQHTATETEPVRVQQNIIHVIRFCFNIIHILSLNKL